MSSMRRVQYVYRQDNVYKRLLHFNMFQGQGVAYRGRILVELSTQLDGKIEKNVDDISSDDILVAQV